MKFSLKLLLLPVLQIEALMITELFAKADLPANRILYLHTCLRGLHQRTGIAYPELAKRILEELLKTKPQAILIPAFTIYSYMAARIFHAEHSHSEVGRFSEEIRLQGFRRTADPMYSVLDILASLPDGLNHRQTFGPQTLFDFLFRENAIIVNIDMNAFYATPIHELERRHQVPYRLEIDFPGMIQLDEEPWQAITYRAYVRRLAKDGSGSYPPYNHQRRLAFLREEKAIREATTAAGTLSWTDLATFTGAIDKALAQNQLFLVDSPPI